MRYRLLILVLLLVAAAAACGKKGPPLPPLPPYPADPQAPRARQAGDQVEVLVRVPSRRVDGEPIQRLAGLRIFRQVLAAPEGKKLPAPSVLPGDVLPVAVVLGDEDLENLTPGGTWVFTEPLARALDGGDPQVPHRLAYSVRYLLQGNRWAPHSRPGVMYSGSPVAAPQGLTAAPVNEGIRLQWQAPGPGLPGAIFRREPEGSFPFDPLTVVPEGVGEWLDPTVAMGRTYLYEVRSRRGEDAKASLSAPAGPVTVTMEDYFPPLAPRDLQALERPGGVDLFWRPGTEIDLAGYRVWRRRLPDGPWQTLTPEPLTGTSYSDDAVEMGVGYEYAISAVDSHVVPNESPRGSPVAARPLAAPPRPVEEPS